MSGNITDQVEVKIENDCDPLHLPIQIKLEEESSLKRREDIFVISTYEDLGIKEEPPVLGLESDFPAYHQVDETTSDNRSKSEHDGHSSQSTVEIPQLLDHPKLPCTEYDTIAFYQIIDHKGVFRNKMKCRGCGFTTTDKAEIKNHVRTTKKVRCQVCHKEISVARFAIHSQTCSSIKKKLPYVYRSIEKIKGTVLEDSGNKNKKIESEDMNDDWDDTPNLELETSSSVQPEDFMPSSILIEQVCNFNHTPKLTNPSACTSYTNSGSIVIINNKKTFKTIKKCKTCGFTTYDSSEMLKHINKFKIPKTSLKCSNCDEKFNTITKLKSHLQYTHHVYVDKNIKLEIKTPKYEAQCHLCKQLLNTKASLKRHLYGVHNILNSRDISNDCYVCTEKFHNNTSFQYHLIKIHDLTDTVPHCLTCGHKSTSRRGLLRHLHVRHRLSANRYKCNLCYCIFTKSDTFILHNKIRHNININLICDMCGVILNSKKSIRDHIINELDLKYNYGLK